MLITLLVNCVHLENSNQSQVMECGRPSRKKNHLKHIMPDLSEFPPDTSLEANILKPFGFNDKLATISKSCVLYSESQWLQNSWLHVKTRLG